MYPSNHRAVSQRSAAASRTFRRSAIVAVKYVRVLLDVSFAGSVRARDLVPSAHRASRTHLVHTRCQRPVPRSHLSQIVQARECCLRLPSIARRAGSLRPQDRKASDMDPGSTTQRTALITGASGGIGLELTRLLAADHNNIVLVGRDHQRLERVAADLRTRYHVTVRCEAWDLSEPGTAA